MFKGIVKLSKNGKGSLLVSEDLSFKLSRKELFKVFPGDKVECSVQQDKATIQKIIERNTTEVIGKLKKTNKGWIAESVNNEFHLEIVIKKNTSKKLKNGDFCKIKIKKQPSLKHRPEGYIVEQLIFSNIFEEADEIALQTNLNIKRTFPKTILPEINKILKEHNSGNFPSEYEDLTDKSPDLNEDSLDIFKVSVSDKKVNKQSTVKNESIFEEKEDVKTIPTLD